MRRALLLAADCHVQDCVFDIAKPRIARTLRSNSSDAGSGIDEADMNMLSNWNSGQLPHVGSTPSIPKKRTDAKSAKPDGKVKRAKLSGSLTLKVARIEPPPARIPSTPSIETLRELSRNVPAHQS
jgi:hypothetical protein